MSLRELRYHLERYQDAQNDQAGKHVPIRLTVSILAELLKQMENESENFCQHRRTT